MMDEQMIETKRLRKGSTQTIKRRSDFGIR